MLYYITMLKESSKKVYTIEEKLQWFQQVKKGTPISEITQKYKISRKTYYKWHKRFVLEGKEGLNNLPPIPKRKHRKFSPENITLVFKIREETGFGPRKLSSFLLEYYLLKISPSYISQILKKPKPVLSDSSTKYSQSTEYVTQDRKDANLDLIINRLPL